eukprot:Sdes_comp20263_c0_seq1m13747
MKLSPRKTLPMSPSRKLRLSDEEDFPSPERRDLLLEQAPVLIDESQSRRKPENERRPRGNAGRRFTPEEEAALLAGVRKHNKEGQTSHWNAILREYEHIFRDRTGSDLKDKWRNMQRVRSRKDLPPRKYVLLYKDHKPVKTNSGKDVILGHGPGGSGLGRIRYPRDAALKAAKRSEIYETDSNETEVFIREVGNQCNQRKDYVFGAKREPPRHPTTVYVYKATRKWVTPPPNVEKFKNYSKICVTKVKYLRQEKLKYGKFAVKFDSSQDNPGEMIDI